MPPTYSLVALIFNEEAVIPVRTSASTFCSRRSTRQPIVLHCAASPRAVGRRRSVRARVHLRIERDRAVAVRRPEPRAGLEFNDCHHRGAWRRQHADDRRDRAQCRAHLCRGEGPAALIVERAIGFEDGPTAARRAAAAPSSRKGTGRGAGLPPRPRETNAGRSARRFALSSMIRRP
jgi:hypothetical protein